MRPERIQLVNDIAELLKRSAFVYLVSYKGLKVDEFAELREKLAETDAECHVIKNTFLIKSAEVAELTGLSSQELTGDTAMVTGNGDLCATAKTLKEFAKDKEAVEFKLGLVDGDILAAAEVNVLAELPPKEALQAQLLGVLQAPARNLVSVLDQKVATIAYVLKAFLDKQS